MTERILFGKPCMLQKTLVSFKRSHFRRISLALSDANCKGRDKAESILKIMLLNRTDQPVPIQVCVSQNNPREGFREPRLQIFLSQCRKQHFCRIPLATRSYMRKPGITQ